MVLVIELEFQNLVRDFALLHGWKYYSIPDSRRASMRGWPDAVIYSVERGRILFVEFKSARGLVRPEQVTTLDDLSHFGESFIWRPGDEQEAFAELASMNTKGK